jgi:hypothetical protein
LNDDLVKARAKGYKTQYDKSPIPYKAPEIEAGDRTFFEGARFYKQFEGKQGVKIVAKPEGEAFIRDLEQEKKLFDWQTVHKPKQSLLLSSSRAFNSQSRNHNRLDSLDKTNGIDADTKSIISHLSRGRPSNFTPKAKDKKSMIQDEIEKLKLGSTMTSFTPNDHVFSKKQKLINN